MLIEFSVSNFRSIKDSATLSMVASAANEFEGTNILQSANNVRVLASAAVYGPNASGKSSLLLAIEAMRSIVVGQRQRGDEIEVEPYLFDIATANSETEFEVTFFVEGVRYQYGFAATKKKVISEWLYAFPKGRAQTWIARDWVEKAQKYETSISEKVSGTRSVWIKATRENALLLSTAVQLNCRHFYPVFDWFQKKLRVIKSHESYPGYTGEVCSDRNKKDRVLKLLKSADFDIEDVHVEKKRFDPSTLPEDMPEYMVEELKERLKDKDLISIKTVHSVSGGNLATIDLEEESDGTQRFFGLIGPWIDILESGKVIFVDELHGSLHPLLVKRLVQMFHNPKLNRYGAQLIFTTHDTAILSQDVFRRDQIWFTEKKIDGSTKLYPLTDFSPRKGAEDIRTNYLDGRYGALPYFSDIHEAMGAEHG